MTRHLILAAMLFAAPCAFAKPSPLSEEVLPTGQRIIPVAAPGAAFAPLTVDLPGQPGHKVGQASAMALSPDGRTLLILTSGSTAALGPTASRSPISRTNMSSFMT